MARVTVEDCIDKVDSPYELVLVAKERATQLNSGVEPSIERDNDKNTVIALREIAEEKEQSKSQEDILPEESIYKKFTPNKDTNLFSKWHEASWSDKLRLLDKFEDERLVGFGKKIIFQEAPHVLPESILKQVKRDIAKRILSDKKEKWWTCKEFYFECDNLRDKFTNENDEKNLKFLDQLNNFVMSIEKKYQNV